MAITYTTPDGTMISNLSELAAWVFKVSGEAGTTPTNAELVVYAHRKPGTPTS